MERLHFTRTLEKVREHTLEKAHEGHFSKVIESPVGAITLVARDEGLCAVLWGTQQMQSAESKPARTIVREAELQLKEYFRGRRTGFDLPLTPHGTDFQLRVWNELRKIPYGETITYGEQARRLRRPNAARAVGAANGRNPIGIIVPCHRVVGASGALIGFAGGIEMKKFLLALEKKSRAE